MAVRTTKQPVAQLHVILILSVQEKRDKGSLTFPLARYRLLWEVYVSARKTFIINADIQVLEEVLKACGTYLYVLVASPLQLSSY